MPELPRIEEFITLCTVIEQRSFTRAAAVLGVTQPAVSQQMKALEEHYGTSLIHREGTGVVPTEAGAIVYEYAVQMFKLYEQSKQRLREQEENLIGELAIGASTGVGEYLLPRAMVAFRADHPESMIRLQVGDSNEILERILQHRVDLGFVGITRRDRHLQFEAFVSDRLVFVVAADHELARRGLVDWGAFQRIPLVLQQASSGATRALRDALQLLGIRIEDLNVVLEVGLQESTKNAVLAGGGGTIISRLGVLDELRARALVEISIEGLDLRHDFHVAYRRSWPLSRLAQAFLETARHFAQAAVQGR